MSAQVGSGHIAIFPTMTGFKATVTKGTREAGAAGAQTFGSGFRRAGRDAGRTLGTDLKRTFGTAAGDLGASTLRKLHGDVTSASNALSKARLKQQDDAGRVRVAEARLREAVERSGAESASAAAAEERLASVRRAHASTTEAVAAATARLNSAQTALTAATEAMSSATARGGSVVGRFFSDLRAGYSDARAGTSVFTGVAGSLGGIAKEIVMLGRNSKLGIWASAQAAEVSRRFTSLATMVGGGVARALVATRTKLGEVGSYVGAAFTPMTRYVAAAGTIMASPFVRLGRSVQGWLAPVTRQVSGLFSKIGNAGAESASRLGGAFRSGVSSLGAATSGALQSVVTAASNAGSAAGRALGGALKGAATSGIVAAGAAIGVAFSAGFSRLNALDTARAKLTGLGNDGQTVAGIMKDATGAVKGTAFGLGEAASVAAGAVAAQIKPGEALQSHLKRIANNASAAGVSMEEMGALFNKAATQANGVQNDVIGQLADKGIPIYQALADQLGVTSGEVFKMASEGKVDFETFAKAAEDAAGTVAEEIGKTVPGAAKNLKASLGRIGANLFGGISEETGEMYGLYAKVGPLISSVTTALGPFEDRAKRIGATLEKSLGPALDRVTGFLTKLGEGSEGIKSALGGLAPVLAPLGAAFAALGAGGIAGMLAKVPVLGGMLGGLTGPLAALGGPLGIAAAAIAGFIASGSDASGLVTGITGIVDQVIAALPGLIDTAVEFIPRLVESIGAQVPQIVEASIGIVEALVQGLANAVPLLVAGAVDLVAGLTVAIIGALPLIVDGAVQLVNALASGLVTAMPALMTGAVTLVIGLLQGIVNALPLLIDGAIVLVTSLVQALVDNLPMLIDGSLQMVTALVQGLIEALPLLIEGAIQLLIGLLTAIVENLPLIIQGGIELVLALIIGLLEVLPQLIEAGIGLVVAIITGLIEAIPQIVEMLPQIISAIWDGLANVNWLDLGAQIIQGVIDGFFSMVGAVGDAVGSVVSTITDFFPHSPAKRGPLSGAGWYRLKDSGGAMIAQFNDGALEGASEFEQTMAAIAQSATQQAQTVIGQASATMRVSGGGPAATSGKQPFQQVNHFAHEDPQVAVEMAARKLENALGGA